MLDGRAGVLCGEKAEGIDRHRVGAADLPVVVDGDPGFGAVLNAMYMVRVFEDAGAAAVQIEDQILPKKSGHLNVKKLADPSDMVAKVAAAAKTRRHLVVVARTDGAVRDGIDGAVDRAKLYVEAGADAIFLEVLNSAEPARKESDRGSFGWAKTVAELSRTRLRGTKRVAFKFTFTMTTYNLMRLPRLLAAA